MNLIVRHFGISTILAICLLIETIAYTYAQQEGKTFYYSSSIVYLLASLSICILPLFHKKKTVAPEKSLLLAGRLLSFSFLLFMLGLLMYHVAILIPVIKTTEVNVIWADMLPSIQLACRRFLSGETVYGPATEIWPNAIIPYLPMMWIPFLPAEIFHFDLRWITVCALFVGLFIASFTIFKARIISFSPLLFTSISLFLLLNYFLMKYIGFWVLTEEGLVGGFYLLLAASIFKKNYWGIGLALTCCTLSRYSLLLWVPVYFGYVFLAENTANFRKLATAYGVSMLVLFVLPFFIHNPLYFLDIPSTYGNHVPNFWKDFRLDQGSFYTVGFYKFFSSNQINLMFELGIVTSFLAPILFLLFANFLSKKYCINNRYFAFGSLKLSLLFFYGFIQMPFPYLFITPTIISYAVMFDVLASENQLTAIA